MNQFEKYFAMSIERDISHNNDDEIENLKEKVKEILNQWLNMLKMLKEIQVKKLIHRVGIYVMCIIEIIHIY